MEYSTKILSLMAKEIIEGMKSCIDVLDDCHGDERLDKEWENKIAKMYYTMYEAV